MPGLRAVEDTQSQLNSFLWTIKPSYFFGTIHILYTRVWDFIADSSKKASQHSSIVYFELDLTGPYTVSVPTSCQMLPQGENLQDGHLLPPRGPPTVRQARDALWMTPEQRGKGLCVYCLCGAIAGNWERRRPIWVPSMTSCLTEVSIKSRGCPR
ncbi:hypothetical protein MC885_013746 [Smutsia gigantea]|nr:hypothetical protein MC885_013746 [Smutsia gigantea]